MKLRTLATLTMVVLLAASLMSVSIVAQNESENQTPEQPAPENGSVPPEPETPPAPPSPPDNETPPAGGDQELPGDNETEVPEAPENDTDNITEPNETAPDEGPTIEGPAVIVTNETVTAVGLNISVGDEVTFLNVGNETINITVRKDLNFTVYADLANDPDYNRSFNLGPGESETQRFEEVGVWHADVDGLAEVDIAVRGPNTVFIQDFQFSPQQLTVPVGTTVTWVNEDRANHSLSFDELPDSGFTCRPSCPPGEFNNTMVKGTIVTYTFDQPGTFEYRCLYHPETEIGTIVVTDGERPPAPPGPQEPEFVPGEVPAEEVRKHQPEPLPPPEEICPATIPENTEVDLELTVDGLTHPVWLISLEGDDRTFVVDQTGTVWIIKDGELLEEPFLNITDRLVDLIPRYDERGLLGMAFHPDYDENGFVYVYYTAPPVEEDQNCSITLSRFNVSDDPDRVDNTTEQVLFSFDKRYMWNNGGDIRFGPDGFLYIPIGDGGTGNHTIEERVAPAQNLSNPLGKILRIDVDATSGDRPYGFPDDNPFLGVPGVLPGVYAFGFRNPAYISFDERNDLLFVADPGENCWEEVSIVSPGCNYGWNLKEATHCFDPEDNTTCDPPCRRETGFYGEPLVNPVIEVKKTEEGNLTFAIIGGHIYNGTAMPEVRGGYLFGSWGNESKLYIACPSDRDRLWEYQNITVVDLVIDGEAMDAPNGTIPAFLLGFGQDNDGESYVLTAEERGPEGETGKVWRIVPRS